MKREIILLLLIISICTLSVRGGESGEDIKQAIKNYYHLYFVKFDKNEYGSILTKDYLLLENGEIFNANDDIAAMPDAESGYTRTDTFDFRSIKIEGNIAYAVYFLKSEISDKTKGVRNLEWLESVILRKSDKGWLIALLHSTRITK